MEANEEKRAGAGVQKRRGSGSSGKPYKGIRMRKWGKWVTEIREPNTRSRIWLGSYSTPMAAARAYDTAVYYLRGPTARLNFPELIIGENHDILTDMSAAGIRKKAVEVGTRVDALQETSAATDHHRMLYHTKTSTSELKRCWFHQKLDLNKKPVSEDPDHDFC